MATTNRPRLTLHRKSDTTFRLTDDEGLLHAFVCYREGLEHKGWQVNPQTSARRHQRVFYPSPHAAAKAFYRKREIVYADPLDKVDEAAPAPMKVKFRSKR